MAKFWDKLKNIFSPRGTSFKCFLNEQDGKWYRYQKGSGGRWEECIPAIAYETCTQCDPDGNCEPHP